MLEHVTASPLTWPEGWARSKLQVDSRFGRHDSRVTIAKAIKGILHELELMGIPDWNVIISTNLKLKKSDALPISNQREPDDTGVSVWWRDGEHRKAIALDKFNRTADNLWAIAKTIEAMRGIGRWGSGEILERTFNGFTALPAPDQVGRPWRDVLDYYGDDIDDANVAYKIARSKAHPDNSGSQDQFYEVNKAWAQAEKELSK